MGESPPVLGGRPRLLPITVAAFWILVGGSLGRFGLNGPATVLVFLATAIVLPCAAVRRPGEGRTGGAGTPRLLRVPLPMPLWAFAGLATVSAVQQRTEAGVQNALVYLTFVAVMAIAAAWTSPGSAMLLLRWVRAAAVVAAVGYLLSVALDGPGNSSLYPKRIFGEVVWIGMVAAVPLAGRSRWGYAAPLLLITADVLSLSRTSAVVCALLFLGVVAKGRSRGELRRLVVLASVVVGGTYVLMTRFQPLRDRFTQNDSRTVAGLQIGTSGRSDLWAVTWDSIKESPWLGHGIGSVERLLAALDATETLGHPHNDYLRLWNDLGLVGLALWVAAILLLGRDAYRRRRAATDSADWAIHQAALLALIGLSLNVVTSNLLVYVFVMVPVAVVVGTSIGQARVTDGDVSPARPQVSRGAAELKNAQKCLNSPKATYHALVPRSGHLGCHDRNNPKGFTLDLRGFLRVLTRRWVSITMLTVAGLGAGLAVTEVSTPQYEARSQIFVSTRATSDIAELNQGSAFSQARVQSYADIVSSARIVAPVINRLGLDMTPDQLAKRINAGVKPNTVLIDIAVTDTDAVRAAKIANTVADEAGVQIVSLETPPGQSAPVHIGTTRSASAPTAPLSPRPLLNAAAGLFAGLIAGVALAVLRDILDTTLRTSHALAEATGLPVLGAVPYDKDAQDSPLAVGPGAHSARAEAFRLVRTNLQFAQVDRSPRVIVVTSPLPGEGKTNTAANLALSLTEAGRSVCLVDADLRSPSVAKTFGLVQDAGLTTVLIGTATVDEVLQQGGEGKLSVLTSGPIPPNPAEILTSDRMRQVLEGLAEAFDVVVVDSAPLMPVADTVGLAPLVDGAVLVVRAGHTPSERAQAAVAALRSVGAPVLGAVLSMAKLHNEGYGYGYGYGYGETAGASEIALTPSQKSGEDSELATQLGLTK
ncbi:hypothetical protein GCM10010193_24080 [Kitasatospora atroaurantiaca]|uniref:non-specific protein-tyrosine kinase n=1 Tax=Kitasatospora atroaurantiaca TaxID=285545 RepID=A0A561F0X7_9ACTN|nr:polysaccharide biosynthesis tyrosine autokinase [Kitasatospora atroaurantiaca]TWE21520.1 capsular exopolysaccharide synthesis family protein [Kitasatospora atroaurantiaca]